MRPNRVGYTEFKQRSDHSLHQNNSKPTVDGALGAHEPVKVVFDHHFERLVPHVNLLPKVVNAPLQVGIRGIAVCFAQKQQWLERLGRDEEAGVGGCGREAEGNHEG